MHFTDDLDILRIGEAALVGLPSAVQDEVARCLSGAGATPLWVPSPEAV